MPLTIGILVFDDVEVLDFAGPYEVFTTASRVHHRLRPSESPLFHVVLIGRTRANVRARAGLTVSVDHDFNSHPGLDVLVVPGGVVAEELARSEVTEWIATCARSAKLTASVCTGAFLLAKAGLLSGKSATTHWEDIEELRAAFPGINVLTHRRWVDEETVVTSAGISAGIDMSLHLVERLASRELALKTARQMEFDWTENSL